MCGYIYFYNDHIDIKKILKKRSEKILYLSFERFNLDLSEVIFRLHGIFHQDLAILQYFFDKNLDSKIFGHDFLKRTR